MVLVFFMTGLVFLALFYSSLFWYQNVLCFLLISRNDLSVIYCGFISRCMYYLTVKILQLPADMNQASLIYIYIEFLVWYMYLFNWFSLIQITVYGKWRQWACHLTNCWFLTLNWFVQLCDISAFYLFWAFYFPDS